MIPISVSSMFSPMISAAIRRRGIPLARIVAYSVERSATLTEIMLKISANAISPPNTSIIPMKM